MNELRPQTRFELELVAKVNTLEQLNETLLLATTTYQLRMVEQDMQIEKQGLDIAFLKGVISEQALLLDAYREENQTKVAGVDFKGYEAPADFFGEGIA